MKQTETIHIDLELPAGTTCAFMNYFYFDECGNAKMGARQISAKNIKSGKSKLADERKAKNENSARKNTRA